MTVNIETARHGDIEPLARLDGDRAQTAQRVAAQRNGHGRLLVARRDGEAVGELYIRLEPPEEPELADFGSDTALLERALVAESHRRQGIGRLLMTTAEQWLAEQGYRRVALAVKADNTDARRLYQDLCYIESVPVLCRARGSAPGSPPDEKCIVMEKALPRRARVSAGSTA